MSDLVLSMMEFSLFHDDSFDGLPQACKYLSDDENITTHTSYDDERESNDFLPFKGKNQKKTFCLFPL